MKAKKAEEKVVVEIIVEPRRTVSLRRSVAEAIESGEYGGLHDEIFNCFTDDQVEQIEGKLESGDVSEAIDEILDQWNGDDVDDLVESIEAFFEASGLEVRFEQDEFAVEQEEGDEGYDYADDIGDDEDADDDEDEDDEEPEEEEEEEDDDREDERY